MELSNEFEVAVPVDQAWALLTDLERIAPCLPGAQLNEVDGDDFRGTVKVKVGPITAQYKGTATFVEKDDGAHRVILTATGRDTRGQGNASATIVAELEPRGDGVTHVSILTDLAVTGKVAQFGRGVMADVSAKLLDQFVDNLETTVLADLVEADASDSAPAPSAPGEVARRARNTTEMLASELAKAWEEAKEGIDGSSDDAPRVEREPLEPRPDLLVPEPEPEPEPVAARRVIDSPEVEPIDLLGTAGAPVLQRAAPLLGLAAAVLVLVAIVRRRRRRRS